jgi:hypothetical protein
VGQRRLTCWWWPPATSRLRPSRSADAVRGSTQPARRATGEEASSLSDRLLP